VPFVKPGFRIKPYKHPKLKFVVRGKVRGKWDRKYFRTKGEAQTYCELRNIELTNHGKEAVEFPSWLRVMAGKAHEQLQPHGKTIEDAVSFFLDHLAKLKKSVPLRQAMDELIENRRQSGSTQVYCNDLKWRLGRFCADFAERNTEEISTAELDQWLVGIKVAPITRNTYRRDLRTLFSFCVSRGYSTANPVEGTRIAKDVPKPVEILTVDQTSRLLTTATESLIPYIAIGAFAGLRAAEVERLDWSNVDLESGLIEVTAKNSKTATRRLVRILPNLRAWLTPLKQHAGPVVPLNLRKLMLETRKRAGLAEWPNNALRHSYASYHIAHFNDASALALQMGHGTTNMIFAHYREVVRPQEAEKFWKIVPATDTGKVIAFTAR
jgi:integrase